MIERRFELASVHRCPLCGEPVSWAEKQAGEYACLTVCVPLIPFPRHLVEKHPQYLGEAKKLARPVFYSSAASAAALAVFMFFGLYELAVLVAVAALGFFMIGWSRRVRLIRRYRFS